MSIYDIIGISAPLFFVTAYMMTAIGKWDGSMARLHWCNLIGALAILVSLTHAWNLPMFVMEVCWSSIAIYGLWRCYMIRQKL
ncbi:MAG: hypothetical protein J0M34_08750 [Alphaproteobacteria bacterium]|nr:hypothetical protein [Alphaproteobacteria bacterium]